MRRLILNRSVLVLVMVVALLCVMSACAAPAPAPAPTPTPAPAPAPVPAPAPAQPEKVIKWSLQSLASSGNPLYLQGAVPFAERVSFASGGRLVIEPFASGAILPKGEEMEGIRRGSVEIGHASHTWGQSEILATALLGQSIGGLTGAQTILWDSAGGGRELCQDIFKELGVHYVSKLTVTGAEAWGHSTKPLNSLDDIKGWKVRTTLPPLAETFERMGATPVFLTGGEIYESLQRGVIDGLEYSTPAINWEMGFHEVTDYLYLSTSRAPGDSHCILVNPEAWNELSPELKAIVEMAAWEIPTRFFTNAAILDFTAIEQYKAYGVNVLPLPKEIDDELQRVGAEVYKEQAVDDPWTGVVMEAIKEFKEICASQNIQ